MTTNDTTTIAAARMTEARRELEAEYTLAHERIASPGKFEGERLYVPFYWGQGLEGFADEDEAPAYGFRLDATDLAVWPELSEDGYSEGDTLWVEENDAGFVYTAFAPDRPGEDEL